MLDDDRYEASTPSRHAAVMRPSASRVTFVGLEGKPGAMPAEGWKRTGFQERGLAAFGTSTATNHLAG